jgi:putative membrane protein
MKTNKWIYAIVIASLVWVGCDDDDDKIIDPVLNDTDELFVEKAARSNMAEIKFSEIAIAKSTDSLVKSFAQKMVDEHTKAQNELEDIADDFRGVEWPNDLDQGHESIREQLDSVPAGFTFDTLFLGTQERTHLAARTTFQTATTTTTEARVKSYATKYLPAIQAHLDEVDSLQTIVMEDDPADDASADGN